MFELIGIPNRNEYVSRTYSDGIMGKYLLRIKAEFL